GRPTMRRAGRRPRARPPLRPSRPAVRAGAAASGSLPRPAHPPHPLRAEQPPERHDAEELRRVDGAQPRGLVVLALAEEVRQHFAGHLFAHLALLEGLTGLAEEQLLEVVGAVQLGTTRQFLELEGRDGLLVTDVVAHGDSPDSWMGWESRR